MRKPKLLPQVGDFVRLRGRHPQGCLARIGDNGWAFVDWVKQLPGPKIVHIEELELVEVSNLRGAA